MNATSVDIKDRTFLITGGTSGVGKVTALGLARLGAKTVIVSRSRERGEAALQEIAAVTGNDQGEVLVADLALQSSIREAAATFKRKHDRLHVLANLGGAVYSERQLTPEGVERTFAVNYLGHFLLTTQLLDILQESQPARVLMVLGAPRFLRHPNLDFAGLQMERQFGTLRALAQALYAKAFFTFELAQRLAGTGVTAIGFHPGFVRSNLGQHLPWYLRAATPLMNVFGKAECDIGVYLAAAREVESKSGFYFNDNRQIVPIQQAYDDAVGKQLWRVSEDLTAVSTA